MSDILPCPICKKPPKENCEGAPYWDKKYEYRLWCGEAFVHGKFVHWVTSARCRTLEEAISSWNDGVNGK